MLPRIQRIVAAVELFALCLWIGGLFALVVIVEPMSLSVLGSESGAAYRLIVSIWDQFGRPELIFAGIVLVSNILKIAAWRGCGWLQRFVLLASAVLLVFTIAASLIVMPRLLEAGAAGGEFAGMPGSPERAAFATLFSEFEYLTMAKLAFALFIVYGYRHFEDYKLASVARITEPR